MFALLAFALGLILSATALYAGTDEAILSHVGFGIRRQNWSYSELGQALVRALLGLICLSYWLVFAVLVLILGR